MTGSLSPRALSDEESALLSAIVSRLPDASTLIAQLATTVAEPGGTSTYLDLAVPDRASPASVPDGPVPLRAMVRGSSGDPIGEIVVWVRDGRLSALEHAWFSDEPPAGWPAPADLTFE